MRRWITRHKSSATLFYQQDTHNLLPASKILHLKNVTQLPITDAPNKMTNSNQHLPHTKLRIVFGLILAAVSLWTGLIVFTVVELSDEPLFSAVSVTLSTLLLLILGTTDLTALHLRQRFLRCANYIVNTRFSTLFLLGLLLTVMLPIYEIAGLIHCQLRKAEYYSLLHDGWKNRLAPGTGPRMIGQAFSLFPTRQESYFIYQRGRQFYTRRTHETALEELKLYATTFLAGIASRDDIAWCPIFFCCSCSNKSYFHMLPIIAKAEASDFAGATAIEPPTNHVNEYLLWLYHMSERRDLTRDYRDKELYPRIKAAVDNDQFNSSPIYPLLLDHLMQIEYSRDSTQPCSTDDLIRYTEEIITRYGTSKDLTSVAPPNKTFLYFLIRVVANYKVSQIPFETTVSKARHFLEICPEYSRALQHKYEPNELKKIANHMYELERMTLAHDTNVTKYLSEATSRDWMQFAPLQFTGR